MIDRCSVSALSARLPVYGTAKQADFIIAIEQNGAWPARVFANPKWDSRLGQIEQAAAARGGATVLIRRPGKHVETGDPMRRVFISGGFTDQAWCLGGVTSDLESVRRFAETGQTPNWAQPQPPVLLICTNGRRDRCCAIEAVPLLDSLSPRGDIWEVSHLSGHRFAPTGLVLPTGQMLARITPRLALESLAAASRGEVAPTSLTPDTDRGICGYPPDEQVAVSAVQARIGHGKPLAVRPTASGEIAVWDGTTEWLVTVSRTEHGVACAESCGKAALTQFAYSASLRQGSAPAR